MRLDIYLVEKFKVESRTKAAHIIDMGKVKVNGTIAKKPGLNVDGKSIELLSEMDFSTMGGYKLEQAIKHFDIDFQGKKILDVGASNGGFTDCSLKCGAKEVYALDVGECALPQNLIDDCRVFVRDKTNARDLNIEITNGEVDIAVVDVSFISLTYILEGIKNTLCANGLIIALVKPQFEVGQKYLSKNGIVTVEKYRLQAIDKIVNFALGIGLKYLGVTTAPIRDGKNVEYLAVFQKEV